MQLRRVVEALLFAADEALTAALMAEMYASSTGEITPEVEEIDAAVAVLNAEYEETGRTFRIQRWAGGYRMATEPAFAPFLRTMFTTREERRLSRSVMESLAVVAYRQPVTKPEIDFIRGVDSGHAIKKLLEIGFVEVVGRSEAVGRPLLYGTTAEFLDQFGLDTLADLPRPREVEELLNDPAFNRERATLLMMEGLENHGPRTTEENEA